MEKNIEKNIEPLFFSPEVYNLLILSVLFFLLLQQFLKEASI